MIRVEFIYQGIFPVTPLPCITVQRRPSEMWINERGHSLRRMITRISPLGCITPIPILSSKKDGRSVDFGSASTVYFMRRRVIRAFTSF